jgi:hypothetical protein
MDSTAKTDAKCVGAACCKIKSTEMMFRLWSMKQQNISAVPAHQFFSSDPLTQCQPIDKKVGHQTGSFTPNCR